MNVLGIHHITAICSDAQRNADFYAGMLGLRLVKRTVNFDDPTSYHLYYGDEYGSPGSIITFFVWPGAPRGQVGAPQVLSVAYEVPEGAFSYWEERFRRFNVSTKRDEDSLRFEDPDGLLLELREAPDRGFFEPWTEDVPFENAIRGFAGARLSAARLERTTPLLAQIMGLCAADQRRFMFAPESSQASLVLDPEAPLTGSMGAGVVHHIAFRVPDAEAQLRWHELLVEKGIQVTPVVDRRYFRSIYFREPGGVLFELATDDPGFAIDEAADSLGDSLRLPPWLEKNREPIAQLLPPLEWPHSANVSG